MRMQVMSAKTLPCDSQQLQINRFFSLSTRMISVDFHQNRGLYWGLNL